MPMSILRATAERLKITLGRTTSSGGVHLYGALSPNSSPIDAKAPAALVPPLVAHLYLGGPVTHLYLAGPDTHLSITR